MTPKTERLRILATSDVHMHMMAFNYYANTPAPGVGLSALADTISSLRHSAESGPEPRHVLLFDNGDLLQGTPLADHVAENPYALTAFARLLSHLGYDALGLGNHDFDYGMAHLDAFVHTISIPVVSSNLILEGTKPWPKKHVILPCGGMSVGIISVLPPKTLEWTFATLGGAIRIDDMLDTVRIEAAAARAAGADLVVALAHTGLGDDLRENALCAIAKDGAIDALIGGHTHHEFPSEDLANLPGADIRQGTLHGVPTVMPGFGGALLGCLDMDLLQSSDRTWHVDTASACIVPARTNGPICAEAIAPLWPAHIATCQALDTQIGESKTALTSYFAQAAPSNMLALCAGAQFKAIDVARQNTPYADLPLLSAVAPPRAGGRGGPWNYSDIAPGPVRERNLADLQVFTNFVWAVDVSGAEVLQWLECAASSFIQVGKDETNTLIDPSFPAFNFDTLFGLTYTIDPTKAPSGVSGGGRISDVACNGQPIRDTDRFLVAVNSYRACGGGDFPNLHPDRPVLRPKLSASDALRDYIGHGATQDFPSPWRFSDSAKGVQCILRTGPGALSYLSDIAHLSPGPPQLQNDGFVGIPITL